MIDKDSIPSWLEEKLKDARLKLGKSKADRIYKKIHTLQQNGISAIHRDPKKARVLLEKVCELYKILEFPDYKVQGYLGDAYFYNGESDKAEETVKKALYMAQKFTEPLDILLNLIRLSQIYYGRQNDELTIDTLKKALKQADSIGKQFHSVVYCYSRLGELMYKTGKYDIALRNFRIALTLSWKLTFLFSLDIKYKGTLDRGIVDLELRKFFKDKGYALTPHNIISIKKDKSWVIKNQKTKSKKKDNDVMDYYIRMDVRKNELAVCDLSLLYWCQQNLSYLGDIHYEKMKYKKASKAYIKSLEFAETTKSAKDILKNLARSGYIYYIQGENEKALANLSRAEKLAYVLHDYEQYVDILVNLGEILSRMGNAHDALAKYELALKIAEKLQDNHGILDSLLRIGEIHLEKGEYRVAEIYFNKTLNLATEIKDGLGIINSRTFLGDVFFWQGRHKQALTNYRRALNLSKQLSHLIAILNVNFKLGSLYLAEDKYEKARECFQQAINIAKAIQNPIGILDNTGCLGDVYLHEDKYELARECFQQAINIAEEIQNPMGIYNNYRSIGTVYLYEKCWDKALEWFLKGLELVEKHDDALSKANIFICIGQTYLFQKKYNEARKKLEESLTLFQSLSYPTGILTNLELIGNIHLEQKEYKESFNTFYQALEKVGRKNRILMTDWEGRINFNRNVLRQYEGAIYSALLYADTLHISNREEKNDWYIKLISLIEESRGIEIGYKIMKISNQLVKFESQKWVNLNFNLSSIDPFPPLIKNCNYSAAPWQ